MKNIKLERYTVEINAKSKYDEKNSKEQTMFFLNELSIVYNQAAEFNRGNGWQVTANDYQKKSLALHDLLAEIGFYDD